MNIEFENGYRIRRFDEKNFVVEKFEEIKSKRDYKGLKRGEAISKWRIQGYFGYIGQAFTYLLNKRALDSDVSSLEELRQLIDNFKNEVCDKKIFKA